MSPQRFATRPPARLEWHSAHEELTDDDPETFVLHVEFVHAHGIPKGEFTTFSTAGNPTHTGADAEGDGAHV
jgi:hypothetical protein